MHTRAYTATGNVALIDTRMNGRPARVHAIQSFITGGPSAATFNVLGSLKNVTENPATSDFFTLATGVDATTNGGVTFVVDKPCPTIRIVIASLTGGTTPSISFGYAGH